MKDLLLPKPGILHPLEEGILSHLFLPVFSLSVDSLTQVKAINTIRIWFIAIKLT